MINILLMTRIRKGKAQLQRLLLRPPQVMLRNERLERVGDEVPQGLRLAGLQLVGQSELVLGDEQFFFAPAQLDPADADVGAA